MRPHSASPARSRSRRNRVPPSKKKIAAVLLQRQATRLGESLERPRPSSARAHIQYSPIPTSTNGASRAELQVWKQASVVEREQHELDRQLWHQNDTPKRGTSRTRPRSAATPRLKIRPQSARTPGVRTRPQNRPQTATTPKSRKRPQPAPSWAAHQAAGQSAHTPARLFDQTNDGASGWACSPGGGMTFNSMGYNGSTAGGRAGDETGAESSRTATGRVPVAIAVGRRGSPPFCCVPRGWGLSACHRGQRHRMADGPGWGARGSWLRACGARCAGLDGGRSDKWDVIDLVCVPRARGQVAMQAEWCARIQVQSGCEQSFWRDNSQLRTDVPRVTCAGAGSLDVPFVFFRASGDMQSCDASVAGWMFG